MVVKSLHPSVDIPLVPVTDFFLFDPIRKDPQRRSIVALIQAETEESYTYGQVEENVLRLASGLRSMDVRRGVTVQMFGPSGVEIPQICFGILHAGGTVTTANYGYNADELAYQLQDSRPSLIFTTPELLSIALEAAKTINMPPKRIITFGGRVNGHSFWKDIFGDANQQTQVSWTREQLCTEPCYILYSSGTTGRPKGVMQSHYNWVASRTQHLAVVSSQPSAPAGTINCVVFPQYATGGTNLQAGMTSIIFRKFSFRLFLQMIAKHKITSMVLPPPILVMLATSPEVEKYDLSSIVAIAAGGAALSKELAAMVSAKLNVPVTAISHNYGATEMTSGGIWHGLAPVRQGSVGLILPNSEVKLVNPDTDVEVKGPGEAGEIYYKGPNVTLGYLNNEKATKETYVNGWLRTGDVAMYDKDGYFYIVDRIKELIKYKGMQVAPNEIEAVLRTHPEVLDCAVVPVPDQLAGELPRAFVVSRNRGNQQKLAEDIIAFVNQRVADHKHIRGGIVFVEEIPTNATGKILRRVLRDKTDITPFSAKL
ncbi:hypothetical protein SmJEL517_g05479 [Synchytrium microbalum]|uniref:4-coumarate--CoA ligase n=1 Tax=Synchytrium microbalum TaxID=1806994 RepID=A0A507C0I8_9FUNG|nr:uncharacterized protein SmJEL517_g05479 [Synchytrium microbalum]TPX31053.1 hypothetical protein SmJEL517_g05479 [Synchytrium microbalum]